MSLIVQEARKWLGTPYRHQAACIGAGTDCLGLVLGVWWAVIGPLPADVPPYTADWSEPQGAETLLAAAITHFRPKSLDDAAKGDLLLFRMRDGAVAKHLGIQSATADPAFIHAYSGHGVVESRLTLPWSRRIAARFAFPTGDL